MSDSDSESDNSSIHPHESTTNDADATEQTVSTSGRSADETTVLNAFGTAFGALLSGVGPDNISLSLSSTIPGFSNVSMHNGNLGSMSGASGMSGAPLASGMNGMLNTATNNYLNRRLQNLSRQGLRNLGSNGSNSSTDTYNGLTIPELTYTKCPGLKRCRGKWWVPRGKTASDATYCDYCRRKYNIRGCTQYVAALTRNKCNCDSYVLRENIKKTLFTVSVWSRDMTTHYGADSKTEDGYDGVVNIPSNTEFCIFIDSGLPDNQFFTANVTCGGKSVQIGNSKGNQNMHHKHGLLLKGFNMKPPSSQTSSQQHESDDNFIFAVRGEESDAEWAAVGDICTEFSIDITIYNQATVNHRQSSGKFLGTYVYQNSTTSLLSSPDNNHVPSYTINYNSAEQNELLTTHINPMNDYEKLNSVPLNIRVKLICDMRKNVITTLNKPLIKKRIDQRTRIIRQKMEMNTEIEKNTSSRITELMEEVTRRERENTELMDELNSLMCSPTAEVVSLEGRTSPNTRSARALGYEDELVVEDGAGDGDLPDLSDDMLEDVD